MDLPENLDRYDVVSIDTETTGLYWYKDKMFSFSVSLPDGRDFYADIRHEPRALEWLKNEVPKAKRIVNHGMKFDALMMMAQGVNVPLERCECTMIRGALIDENLFSYSLDALAAKYLGDAKVSEIYEELAEIFGGKPTRNAQMPNLHRADPKLVAPYAKKDTRLALNLWQWQEAEIDRQDLHQVWALERRLFRHIVMMERNGIRVDVDGAELLMDRLDAKIKVMREKLDEEAGFRVNPNPSGSIYRLFQPKEIWDEDVPEEMKLRWKDGKLEVGDKKPKAFKCIDGTIVGATPAGKASLNAEALARMKHPAAEMILQCRKMMKTKDTFVGGHILGHHNQGRVHPNINQTKSESKGGGTEGVGPGRLSYTDPALQQIPARDKEIARLVRPIFLPDEDQDWSYGDLDQHEVRIFVHYANPPELIEAYQKNPDLDAHSQVAELTGLPRNAQKSGGANAKQLNLAMIFNMGNGTIADKMGFPTEPATINIRGRDIEYLKPCPEAMAVIDHYHEMFPGVKKVADQAKTIARTRGYVKTIRGRHLRFPGGEFTHKASGLVYQGSAADLNKENICIIAEYLESEDPESRLLLNIHDEYSMSLARTGKQVHHLNEMKRLIQDKPDLRVPIRLDFSKPSKNWWDATSAELATLT